VGWLHNQWVQRGVGGGVLERFLINVVARMQFSFLKPHKDAKLIKLLRRVRKERVSLLTADETFMIYSLARAYADQPAAMAEVGVFQGVSARLICEAKGDNVLHLFDTFEGLPKAAAQDGPVPREKQYAAGIKSVQEFIQGYPNVYLHKGIFPDSAQGLEKMPYSFVHIDVDLYESTKACLEYFYPQLTPGGILISHDYSILAGVKTAFTEFMADKRERLIELPTTQCMIIKL
jgi:O-methyltransferase